MLPPALGREHDGGEEHAVGMQHGIDARRPVPTWITWCQRWMQSWIGPSLIPGFLQRIEALTRVSG
jgi:hypothetical protein